VVDHPGRWNGRHLAFANLDHVLDGSTAVEVSEWRGMTKRSIGAHQPIADDDIGALRLQALHDPAEIAPNAVGIELELEIDLL
jgi:hypothetical protein